MGAALTSASELVLVDSSVWIDYLRGADTAATAELRRLRAEPDRLATTEPVIMEILSGPTDEVRAAMLDQLLSGAVLRPVDPALDYRTAARIHRTVRHSGRTVRSLNDCLIAAVAIRTGVELLHKDADYEAIASCVALRHRSLR